MISPTTAALRVHQVALERQDRVPHLRVRRAPDPRLIEMAWTHSTRSRVGQGMDSKVLKREFGRTSASGRHRHAAGPSLRESGGCESRGAAGGSRTSRRAAATSSVPSTNIQADVRPRYLRDVRRCAGVRTVLKGETARSGDRGRDGKSRGMKRGSRSWPRGPGRVPAIEAATGNCCRTASLRGGSTRRPWYPRSRHSRTGPAPGREYEYWANN